MVLMVCMDRYMECYFLYDRYDPLGRGYLISIHLCMLGLGAPCGHACVTAESFKSYIENNWLMGCI